VRAATARYLDGMKLVALVTVTFAAACGSSTSPPVVTASVTCTAPVVAQTGSDGDVADCTIGAGSCSDGNTYVLQCDSIGSDTYSNCGCAVDGVTDDGSGVEISLTTCATATAVTAAQIERAWLDCGVQLTFPSK
jgi:hypothetical protein